MEPSESDTSRPVASPLFTAALLLVLAAFAAWGTFQAEHMRNLEHPNRILHYTLTVGFEWFLFASVVLAVRQRGHSLEAIFGERWRSGRQLLHDIGIAAAFWLVSLMLLAAIAFLLGITRIDRSTRFMIPQGPLELVLFLALSVSAGICEETVFRGLLQRQFTAWLKSAPAGIVISAVIFGACHAYQGWRRALLIGLYGSMFGMLAHWRRNLRPGMMAHAWQDSFSGIVGALIRRSLG